MQLEDVVSSGFDIVENDLHDQKHLMRQEMLSIYCFLVH